MTIGSYWSSNHPFLTAPLWSFSSFAVAGSNRSESPPRLDGVVDEGGAATRAAFCGCSVLLNTGFFLVPDAEFDGLRDETLMVWIPDCSLARCSAAFALAAAWGSLIMFFISLSRFLTISVSRANEIGSVDLGTDLAMCMVVRAFVGFEVVHSSVAFLAQFTFKIVSVRTTTLSQHVSLQKKVLRASRALSVAALGRA